MAKRKQTNTQRCFDGHKHAIADDDDGAKHADSTRKKRRFATDHSKSNSQSDDICGSHKVVEEPSHSPLCQVSEQHPTSFPCSLDQSEKISFNGKHECLTEDNSSGALYRDATCCDPNPHARKIKFPCSKAPCQVCLTLGWKYFPKYRRGDNPEKKYIKTTLGNLKTSTSCQYCQLLSRAAKQGCQEDKVGDETRVTIYLRPKFTLALVVDEEKEDEEKEDEEKEFSPATCQLDLYTETALNPTVDYCVKFINKQLAYCVSSHRMYCDRSDEQELSTRVIDVGTKDTAPKLLESRGRKAKYITLSHCWGNGEYTPLKTTTASLSSHYKEIPLTKLSQTFRDAVLITRELGIQFIWIDSLCIIQDSPTDWDTESAAMAKIYHHSLLTLSATASTDGRGGCLRSGVEGENIDTTLPTGEKLRHIPVNLGETDIFIRKGAQEAHEIMRQVCEDPQESAPLLSRAWVYQETILSPRTVHFHREELVWECREALRCECGYYDSIHNQRLLLQNSWKSPYTQFLAPIGQLRSEYLYAQWDSIVWAYSNLKLTRDSDRLPALAGLASFSAKNLGEYLVGLWEPDLWKGLLWKRAWSAKCRRLSGFEPAMPTWSWASIIPRNHTGEMLIRDPKARYSPQLADNRFAIIKAKCTPKSDLNPFGQVSVAILRLTGALVEVSLFEDPNKEPGLYYLYFRHQHYIYPVRFGKHDLHDLVFDIVDNKEMYQEICLGESLYCLPVAKSNRRKNAKRTCLVLKKVREGEYMRIGIFRQRRSGVHWVRNVETREIQIV
ncbi:hypothetical protein FHL15_002708 [Xylaria flabelliformis]|uniref:Heterokaryon incompatibility domain-containing protein n=1 Tax=Xylaria flabelliformis TaxID=2512241 RepID=A0A553I8A8_9PEZI|nr:hypothetical protein FHL15_002708 [Xylaria flabelliformis]